MDLRKEFISIPRFNQIAKTDKDVLERIPVNLRIRMSYTPLLLADLLCNSIIDLKNELRAKNVLKQLNVRDIKMMQQASNTLTLMYQTSDNDVDCKIEEWLCNVSDKINNDLTMFRLAVREQCKNHEITDNDSDIMSYIITTNLLTLILIDVLGAISDTMINITGRYRDNETQYAKKIHGCLKRMSARITNTYPNDLSNVLNTSKIDSIKYNIQKIVCHVEKMVK